MKVNISDIVIRERLRDDVGDVEMLKNSIARVGLLHPLILNTRMELISGRRRLEACKQLGWKQVEVKIVDDALSDLSMLDIEFEENLGRMDFSAEERQQYHIKREQIEESKSGRSLWGGIKRTFGKFADIFRKSG